MRGAHVVDEDEQGEADRTLAEASSATESRLRRSEARWRTLAESSTDILSVIDSRGNIKYVSPSARRLLGYDVAPELIPAFDLVHEDDREAAIAAMGEFLTHPGPGGPLSLRVRHADGSWRWFEILSNNLIDDPDVGGLVLNARDTTARHQTEEALIESQLLVRASEARFRALVHHSGDLITVLDARGRVASTTAAVTHILGFREDEVIGIKATDLVHYEDLDEVLDVFAGVATRPGATARIECRLRTAAGGWINAESTVTNMLDDPAVGGIILNSRDTTARVAAEELLAGQAYQDSLTSLPNRRLFLDRLEMALARGRRRLGTVAVLFLDLDRFKVVNDSLGHDAGDQLLIAVADRLKHLLRPGDTVARFGGDEFTLLCENVNNEREPVAIAERVARSLTAPFQLGDREVFLSTSIGIAVSNRVDDDPDSLLRDADSAMYRAKEKGRARFELFDEEMRDRAMERLDLENSLHRALERSELSLHYQPIIDSTTGKAIAAEALLRWDHPQRGAVATTQFIPLAEDTGLIVPIGTWVLEQACDDLVRWRRSGTVGEEFRIWVNLAAGQLTQPELSRTVGEILNAAGLRGSSLGLEITEGALLQDTEATMTALRTLKELGIALSIDDFGTGYSSLSYLKRLPIDELKVDRSFVSGLGRSPEDEAIAATVIQLAENLGLTAVAEGVETTDQWDRLVAMGCRHLQGFLMSRGLPADEFERFLVDRPVED